MTKEEGEKLDRLINLVEGLREEIEVFGGRQASMDSTLLDIENRVSRPMDERESLPYGIYGLNE